MTDAVAKHSTNIYWHDGPVTRELRELERGHRGLTVWLTGLSGSGKSTIASLVEQYLLEVGCVTYTLDGDNLRFGLNRDLSFSPSDRSENVRRVGEVARLFTDAGLIVLAALISPYRADRDAVRAAMRRGDFVEVHVRASLEACSARDPKKLYARASAGDLQDMTGIGSAYEPPAQPELTLDAERDDAKTCARALIGFLYDHGYISNRLPDGLYIG